MEVKELRIGNWINYQGINEMQVKLDEFSDLFNGEDVIEDYKPIPLSEQWLLKFGFEEHHIKQGFGKLYYHRGVDIYKKDGVIVFYVHTNRNWVVFEYVHEIQNFFSSLDRDLKIK